MTHDLSTTGHKQVETLVRCDPRALPSFTEIFGNDSPVEIEIGCGKAKFLIARAIEHPELNFLGIDIVWRWMRFAVERSHKRTLENVKFIKADAREIVRFGIPPASVSVVAMPTAQAPPNF